MSEKGPDQFDSFWIQAYELLHKLGLPVALFIIDATAAIALINLGFPPGVSVAISTLGEGVVIFVIWKTKKHA